MGKETTRNTLLEVGGRIILERGFNHSGIEAVLQHAGVPKGSFYYYFDSKEDFGLQVLDRFVEWYTSEIEKHLSDTTVSPSRRLRNLGEFSCNLLASQECRNGCLVGNLSQEMADQNETFRLKLEKAFSSWGERFAHCIRQAQEVGEISPHFDARVLADFWINAWQGSVLRAKTRRDTEPLRIFLKVMFGIIFSMETTGAEFSGDRNGLSDRQ